MTIPLFESHTGENMFATLVKFMNALIPSWRNHLIGVSTDGDRSMAGRIRGLSTRIESEASPGIIRIWCGLHQMDLVMQRVFKSALNEGYLTVLTTLIGYLRRQQNLIADMRATCPKVATTRWLSMGTVAKWLTSNRARIQRYLQDKNASCAPSPVWWIFLFAIQAIAEEANVVFISLQGLSTLVSQQRARLVGLVETYCRMSGMVGPLETSQLEMIDSSTTARCGKFALSYENARLCLDGLGVWVLETLDTLSQDDVSMLVTAIAQMLCQLAQGLHAVVAERDCVNDVGEELPPVLPHQLARVDVRRFSSILNAHKHAFKQNSTTNKLMNSTNSLLCSCEHIVKSVLLRTLSISAIISRPTSKRPGPLPMALPYVVIVLRWTCLCLSKHLYSGIGLLVVEI
ncbi:hypothetical protein BASA81_014533 [Batrachochytrium salamandrivorans]|nr:hypothetical protein BASA81_014533 [Batrachochytrium salamandrivorans]